VNGMVTLSWLEGKRLFLRSRGFVIITIGFPVMLYLVLGRNHGLTYGVATGAYYMVAMAAFGSFTGALASQAVRISQERKDGWLRQLRLTTLPARSYVAAKMVSASLTTLPSIAIVLLLGKLYGGVDLAGWKWPVIAAVIWLVAISFSALAVAIGYRFMPDRAQPLTTVLFFGMAVLGGLWFPLTGTLADIGKALPTYQVTRIGASVISTGAVSPGALAVIFGWLAAFVLLAVLAVRSTAET